MINNQSVLITGATGFVGRYLIKELVKRNVKLTALVRNSSEVGFLKDMGVGLKYGDLKDVDSLRQAVDGIDIVIHLAALMSDKGHLPYKDFYDINVKGTLNLASVFAKSGKQFIYISTVGVYGATTKEGVDEDGAYGKLLSRYERSKLESEKALVDLYKRENLAWTILRLGLLYGPGMKYGWPQVIKNTQEGKMFIFGKGEKLLHLTNVKDAVNGIILSIGNTKAFRRVLNICGSQAYLVKEVFYEIADCLGVERPKNLPFLPVYLLARVLEILPSKIKPGRLKYLDTHRMGFFSGDHVYKIDKANECLGYCPKIGLSSGIAELADWCQRGKGGV